MTNPYVLYRISDADGTILYVGASINLGQRIYTHSRGQPWWDEASAIHLERFETAEELAAAEIAAIQNERPRYNVVDTERGYFQPYKPRRTKGEGSFYRRNDGVWIGRIELPMTKDGHRRYRSVSSKDRSTALKRFRALQAEIRARGSDAS